MSELSVCMPGVVVRMSELVVHLSEVDILASECAQLTSDLRTIRNLFCVFVGVSEKSAVCLQEHAACTS